MRLAATIAVLIPCLVSCTVEKPPAGTPDFAGTYKQNTHPIEMGFKVYHNSQDSTELYFQIEAADLLYTRKTPNSPFLARYGLNYKILDAEHNLIKDSATFKFVDQRDTEEPHMIQGRIPIIAEYKSYREIEITVIDFNRRTKHTERHPFDKVAPIHLQNFLFKRRDNSVVLSNVLDSDEQIEIVSGRYDPREINILFYELSDKLPPPPFSNKQTNDVASSPDTIFKLDERKITLERQGLYYFSEDTVPGPGFSILRFAKGFPDVISEDMFYKPLRYLTSKEEYQALEAVENKRKGAEEFWLKATGSKERARSLIKAFYNRVKEANRFFSTYKEGWRTDRGLILIIFGPPQRVVRQQKREFWYYGQENSSASLNFSFRLIESPISDNIYELERSITYKGTWFRAVDTWRSGRIHTAR